MFSMEVIFMHYFMHTVQIFYLQMVTFCNYKSMIEKEYINYESVIGLTLGF